MNGVLSPSANSLGLIGNPEHRRIFEFQDSVEKLGWPRPPCLSYEELLENPDALDSFDVETLRIDSPGQNAHVAKALIALGGSPPNVEIEYGEVSYLKEYHRGFCAVLERIEQRCLRCLNSPSDIRVMFDKWASHCHFEENQIPRPPSELAPSHFHELRELMRARATGQVFLKPLHGSSASGVCALRWNRCHQQMISPLRIASKRGQPMLVNTRKIRTYSTEADIQLILNLLLPQGMIMEQWIPKLTLPGGAIDLRVLVIAGEPRHWVIRQSQSPMTNLHLGNRRGDIAILLDLIKPSGLNAAFELATKAAACFPDSLYAGVDLLIDSRHRAFVGEINAFGDLLPRLLHRGESTGTAIARACHEQFAFA